MDKNINLDVFEQDLETHFESLTPVLNRDFEMEIIRNAASIHSKRKKSITLRVHEMDLEIMRLKASKLGIPYQTYINMLIHKDATLTR
jgi:predicted DNA binding CopG/RHH family protein